MTAGDILARNAKTHRCPEGEALWKECQRTAVILHMATRDRNPLTYYESRKERQDYEAAARSWLIHKAACTQGCKA